MQEKIKEAILDFWDTILPKIVQRETKLDLKTEVIIDIVGVRRAGKTFLMLDAVQQLLKTTNKQAIIYINFENRKLLPLNTGYFNQIIKIIYQENLLGAHKKLYLFLDEVQRVKGWEKYIRSIFDEFKGRIKIFISGSNTALLSKKYGELLTGRHLTSTIFPLSFREFLNFNNFKIEPLSEARRAKIQKRLTEYLELGGFPEIVLQKIKKVKEQLLNQLFSDILSRDILGRNETRKEQVLEEFAYFLASNIANLLSFNKMSNYFASRGIKISVKTLENYFSLMKQAFLFFDTTIFSYKVKDQLQYPRKIYCIDNGLANLFGFKFSQNIGRFYENAVAVELQRRFAKKPTVKTFYWKGRTNQEVDFVIKDKLKVKQLIQVCFAEQRTTIPERELNSLIRASQELKCSNLLVITGDIEEQKRIKNKRIKFIPLWNWLLSEKG